MGRGVGLGARAGQDPGEFAAATAGRRPRSRVMDLLIAATAYAHSARLYTRNPRDLAGIEHVIDILAG